MTAIEEHFQRRFQKYPLGSVRLWRHVAKGRKFKEPDVAVFKVFLTVSFELQEWIRRGDVVIVA